MAMSKAASTATRAARWSPYEIDLAGLPGEARPSGALWLPGERLLCVADLHLGKAERTARRGGALLPPYDSVETLRRLSEEIRALDPIAVVCLGDSFDDLQAARALSQDEQATLARLQTGRRWLWIAGNHDPAPTGVAGDGCDALTLRAPRGAIVFRHEAAEISPDSVEVSGHFHPKATLQARGRRIRRRCFLRDARRLILPAFGAYTGGLDAADPVFDALLGPEAQALLLGETVRAAPRNALVAPHALPR